MTPLLEINSLKKYFPVYAGVFQKVVAQVKAVDGVSFSIGRGEILGLVGESGCGKTTLGRMTLRLIEPTDGEILFEGQDILKLGSGDLKRLRPRMQIIFQDPYGSLNPRFTVQQILGEALLVHGRATRETISDQLDTLMNRVGLSPQYKNRYPHEFSGGQRQRVGIARALALNPEYIVCDEPVSALDVSIQAQIINLLLELKEEFNLTLLFISHDLNVVQHLSDRTAVMYLGRVVELASTKKLNEESAHPYTKALLASKPNLNPKQRTHRAPLAGEVPSPMDPPGGCHFHPRCPEARDHCKTETPRMVQIEDGHFVHCHLYS